MNKELVMDDRHDTIFEEEEGETGGPLNGLAEIDFDLLETEGKWLVKVVSGPNSGAEFSLISNSTYLIGTDATTCDIVFNDLSVSRQHARISVDAEEHVFLEDLGSKNGTFVDGEKITQKKAVSSNALISMGTTTFMLIDREGERHTIIQPLFTQVTGKKEEPKKEKEKEEEEKGAPEGVMGAIQHAVLSPIQSEVERIKEEERKEARHAHAISSFIVLAVVTGLFVIAGIGTTFLFKTETIPQQSQQDIEGSIKKALITYPQIRYSFNPSNGKLLLVGHLLTTVDKNNLLDTLQQLPFVSSIDSSNVVIDELVWREMNQMFLNNPSWKTVNMSSPEPGKFVLTGLLKTRSQADALYDYVTQYFPYLDLLDKHVIVEDELKTQIAQRLIDAGCVNVTLSFVNGELRLAGSVGPKQLPKFNQIVADLRAIPGIRSVVVGITEASSEQSMINISDRYQVTGYSALGKNFSVVINGRIVTKGDSVDGMIITDIQPHAVILEKDGFKYRIDFNM